ncbi:hypothetical protein F0L68_13450 [Solihabitans fulvus]|uniref:Uncharacterized protein n=1 Tax=Solihabitans fulvus TaxID=1892852 RepID=A0A5B2XHK8_9PSEU|nr:hypothetical protein [Solihabitans fulvus]KAA2262282.1 hypothetical protein F0L68_13450 [Solihabitans fulvus]
MGQLSFFSAEARQPDVGDLAGLLCGPGQAVSFARGTAARVSVVLDEPWRAGALMSACAERGVLAQLGASEEGHALVRTAFRTDLTTLAAQWLRGAVKSVPAGFEPHGAELRLWALTSGRWSEGSYLLGLDPDAPDTHEPLREALACCCLPATVLAPRGGEPALRVTGRRRLARLAELVGRPPRGVVQQMWPAA